LNLLQVRNLKVHFPLRRGALGAKEQSVKAVDDVNLDLAAAETLGVVGESGCGKTTLGRAIVRLIKPTSGRVLFEGQDITTLSFRDLRNLRRGFQMIFQDPIGSLNPRMTVEEIVGEALDIHGLARGKAVRRKRVLELLEAVGLQSERLQQYPHEFSGGQRQRIGIARALAVEPKMIVCDEPVSALDVSVRAQIVNLLQELQERRGIAYIFVAHDLAVVEHISHRVMVMYLGKAVEVAPSRELVTNARHPYTQALLSAVPEIDPLKKPERIILSGDVPSPIQPPSGCAFNPRCPWVQDICRVEMPPLRELSPGHFVACHVATALAEQHKKR